LQDATIKADYVITVPVGSQVSAESISATVQDDQFATSSGFTNQLKQEIQSDLSETVSVTTVSGVGSPSVVATPTPAPPSPPASSSNDDDDDGVSTGVVVGIIVGAVVLLLVCAIGMFAYGKQKGALEERLIQQQSKQQNYQAEDGAQTMGNAEAPESSI
jgi:flagellar basal body-associated protein FliL